MDDLLVRVQALGNFKRVTQVNQTIEAVLSPFQSLLPAKPTDEQIASYEAALIPLLKINNGNLSPHCAIFIGKNLVEVYRLERTHRFWNLISLATTAPTPAVIWAMGHVISKIGHFSRSSLGNLAQSLTGLKEPLVFPALFALRNIFKICGDILTKIAVSAFSFATRLLSNQYEQTQIAAIRLLEVLVKCQSISIRKIISEAENAFKYCHSRFAIEAAANLVAICAVVPYIKADSSGIRPSTSSSDFELRAQTQPATPSNLNDSLAVLKRFRTHFSVIFPRYLDLLTPEFIFANAKQLVRFAVAMSPIDQSRVTAFFGRDVRSEVLQTVMSLTPPPFNLIRTMVFDSDSTKEVSKMAFAAITGNNPDEKMGAQVFFIAMTNSYPDLAVDTLDESVAVLAEIGDSADLRVVNGHAAIASLILSATPQSRQLVQVRAAKLRRFIEFAISKDKEASLTLLESLFRVLATLPAEFLSADRIKSTLARVVEIVQKIPGFDDKHRRSAIPLIEVVLLFLSIHANAEGAVKVLEATLSILSYLPNTALTAVLNFAAETEISGEVAARLSNFFVSKLAALGYSMAFVKKQLPPLIPTPDDPFRRFKTPLIGRKPLFVVEDPVLGNQITELLPLILRRVSDSDFRKLLQATLKSLNKLSVEMLLLSLYQNEAICARIPPNFHEQLLKLTVSDSVQLQIIAECVAEHVLHFPDCSFKKPPSPMTWLIDAALSRKMKMSSHGMTGRAR
jgi:hypothetical protein